MSEDFSIRWANEKDCPRLMELIKELAVYENAPDEVAVSVDEMKAAGFGADAVWKALVIEKETTVVGMSLFYVRYSTWKGRKLYLEDLVVTEKFRGLGLGKRLLDKTIEYATAQGYYALYWQVLDWNRPAIDFYKSYKPEFDAEWINVTLPLSPHSSYCSKK